MKKIISIALTIGLALTVFYSCQKNYGDPMLAFKTGNGWVGRDTILKVTDTIKVGIEADWNGHDLLKSLEIRLNDELAGLQEIGNESANYNITLIKGAQETEVWEFLLSDAGDNTTSKKLTLTKDPNSLYGGVIYFSAIVLGAQNNTGKAGFLSFATNNTYRLDQAYINQDKIDMLCYYDGTVFTTLASPGSDIPESIFAGQKNVINWTTKNKTYFVKTSLKEADFLGVNTDAPIINAWKDTGASLKASDLKVGDVYLFKLNDGKKGMFLVKRLISFEDGEVEFAVKIQD